jgi:hypothetical protein
VLDPRRCIVLVELYTWLHGRLRDLSTPRGYTMKRLGSIATATVMAAACAVAAAPPAQAATTGTSCASFGGHVIHSGYLDLNVHYTIRRKIVNRSPRWCTVLTSPVAEHLTITHQFWPDPCPGAMATERTSRTARALSLRFPTEGNDYVVVRAGTHHKRFHLELGGAACP